MSMWPTTPAWSQTLQGTHRIFYEASAWYGQVCTCPSLPIIRGELTQRAGEDLRSTLTLTVADDGSLTPRRPVDTLAPFGQTIRLRIGVGANSPAEWIPIGVFRIDSPKPSGGWIYRKGTWIPSGGSVELECSDLFDVLTQDQWEYKMSPRKDATIASEVYRQVAGRLPVEMATMPRDLVPSGYGSYTDSPMSNIRSLLHLARKVARMTRVGTLQAIPMDIAAEPTLFLDPVTPTSPHGRLVEVLYHPTREGIFNAVGTSGEGGFDTTTVHGYAEDSSTALSVRSPLGRILRQQSSSWYTTEAIANKGANTLLWNSMRKRRGDLRVRTTFDPAIDLHDTVSVVVQPSDTKPYRVRGLVTDLKYDFSGGPMEMTVACDLEDLNAWPN